MGAARHGGGVRRLKGALGSPQNSAGLEADFGRTLQENHAQADRLHFHSVCVCVCVCLIYTINSEQPIYTPRVGGKKKEIIFTVIGKLAPENHPRGTDLFSSSL